ncbi:MAG: hypothetical protein RLZZ162_3656, partial [Verrucomicrobiota bacterium]
MTRVRDFVGDSTFGFCGPDFPFDIRHCGTPPSAQRSAFFMSTPIATILTHPGSAHKDEFLAC